MKITQMLNKIDNHTHYRCPNTIHEININHQTPKQITYRHLPRPSLLHLMLRAPSNPEASLTPISRLHSKMHPTIQILSTIYLKGDRPSFSLVQVMIVSDATRLSFKLDTRVTSFT